MKKWLKILLLIISILILILLFFGFQYRKSINTLYKSFSQGTETISKKIDSEKQIEEQNLLKYSTELERPFTQEEEKSISQGLITPEDALEIIKKKPTNNTSDHSDDQYSIMINGYITQLYIIKTNFIKDLGQILIEGRSYYLSLPQNEHNIVGKQKTASVFFSKLTDLETNCDKSVETLLTEMKQKIVSSGGDISIVDTLKTSYYNEKELKKEYYLSKLNSQGE